MAVSQVEDTEENIEVAFIKFPMNIEEVVDMIQEFAQDAIEVKPTEDGYQIIVTLDDEAETEEEEIDDIEVATESEEPEELEEPDIDAMLPVEGELEEPVQDANTLILSLEELTEGTVIHSDSIQAVEELVTLINQLLPEGKEILNVEEDLSEELVEEDIEEALLEEDTDMAEADDSEFPELDDEDFNFQ